MPCSQFFCASAKPGKSSLDFGQLHSPSWLWQQHVACSCHVPLNSRLTVAVSFGPCRNHSVNGKLLSSICPAENISNKELKLLYSNNNLYIFKKGTIEFSFINSWLLWCLDRKYQIFTWCQKLINFPSAPTKIFLCRSKDEGAGIPPCLAPSLPRHGGHINQTPNLSSGSVVTLVHEQGDQVMEEKYLCFAPRACWQWGLG